MKKTRQIFSVLLTLAMLLTLVPATAESLLARRESYISKTAILPAALPATQAITTPHMMKPPAY